MTESFDITEDWGDADWEKFWSDEEKLADRYFDICQLLNELHKDYTALNFCESPDLNRLQEQMAVTKDRVFDVFTNYRELFDEYGRKPTFKNMLLLQMERLRHSSDKADKALLNLLEQTFRDKGYKLYRKNTMYILAHKALMLVRDRGISQSEAAKHLAKKYKVSKKTLENKISKLPYKFGLKKTSEAKTE